MYVPYILEVRWYILLLRILYILSRRFLFLRQEREKHCKYFIWLNEHTRFTTLVIRIAFTVFQLYTSHFGRERRLLSASRYCLLSALKYLQSQRRRMNAFYLDRIFSRTWFSFLFLQLHLVYIGEKLLLHSTRGLEFFRDIYFLQLYTTKKIII